MGSVYQTSKGNKKIIHIDRTRAWAYFGVAEGDPSLGEMDGVRRVEIERGSIGKGKDDDQESKPWETRLKTKVN